MPTQSEKHLVINEDAAMTYVSSLTRLSIVATDKTVEAVSTDLNFVQDELSSLVKHVEEDVYPEALQKVWVKNNLTAEGKYGDLSVMKISKDDYEALVALSGDILSNNVLYIIDSDYEDAYGQQIKNIADGTDLNDAVNIKQLQNAISVALSGLEDILHEINTGSQL